MLLKAATRVQGPRRPLRNSKFAEDAIKLQARQALFRYFLMVYVKSARLKEAIWSALVLKPGHVTWAQRHTHLVALKPRPVRA